MAEPKSLFTEKKSDTGSPIDLSNLRRAAKNKDTSGSELDKIAKQLIKTAKDKGSK